jgi:hypothetical protein
VPKKLSQKLSQILKEVWRQPGLPEKPLEQDQPH